MINQTHHQVDLFWSPVRGELVVPKPQHASRIHHCDKQAQHPLRVVKVSPLDGVPMVWVEPTGPIATVEIKGRQPRVQRPNWQSPCLVDHLMPYEAQPK